MIVPRLRAKVDGNQALIVQALRDSGCSVVCLHQLGGGIPDLLVATPSGETLLVEVKSAQGSLTPDQERFLSAWRGRVEIIRDPDEIARLLGNSAGIPSHTGTSAGTQCPRRERQSDPLWDSPSSAGSR